MGVTIHYKGQIDDLARIPALRDELADVARAMRWDTSLLDDDFSAPPDARLESGPGGARIVGHLGLKGISIAPARCDLLWFCVDRDGVLRSPLGMVSLREAPPDPYAAWISCKTQFSSPETHAWIVGLLRHLKNRYFSNLEVLDEGGYWDSGDSAELRRRMDAIGGRIARLAGDLSSSRFSLLAGRSGEEIADAIEKLVRDQNDSPPPLP